MWGPVLKVDVTIHSANTGGRRRLHTLCIENQGPEAPVGDYFAYYYTHHDDGTYDESSSFSIHEFDRSRGALALIHEALKAIDPPYVAATPPPSVPLDPKLQQVVVYDKPMYKLPHSPLTPSAQQEVFDDPLIIQAIQVLLFGIGFGLLWALLFLGVLQLLR